MGNYCQGISYNARYIQNNRKKNLLEITKSNQKKYKIEKYDSNCQSNTKI
jgi:hypothetical protein